MEPHEHHPGIENCKLATGAAKEADEAFAKLEIKKGEVITSA